jgi:hypothetical protein
VPTTTTAERRPRARVAAAPRISRPSLRRLERPPRAALLHGLARQAATELREVGQAGGPVEHGVDELLFVVDRDQVGAARASPALEPPAHGGAGVGVGEVETFDLGGHAPRRCVALLDRRLQRWATALLFERVRERGREPAVDRAWSSSVA